MLCFISFSRSRDGLGLWFFHGFLRFTSTSSFWGGGIFLLFHLRFPLSLFSRLKTEVGASLPFPTFCILLFWVEVLLPLVLLGLVDERSVEEIFLFFSSFFHVSC